MKKQNLVFILILIIAASLFSQTKIWFPINSPANRINSLAAKSNSGEIFAGTENGIFCSSDTGANWDCIGLRDYSINIIQLDPEGHIYAGANQAVTPHAKKLYFSNDGGSNWMDTGLSEWIHDIAFNSSGHVYTGTSNGIFRLAESNDGWSHIAFIDTFVSSLIVKEDNSIFVGTDYYGVYNSDDNGDNWLYKGLFDTHIKCMGVDQNQNIYVGSSMGEEVYVSKNNGTDWQRTNLNQVVEALAVTSKGFIFAGTFGSEQGPFVSYNTGDSWEQINAGMKDWSVNSFAVGPNDLVYARTWGDGIFIWVDSTFTSIKMNTCNRISSLSLLQNYPNPFNPTTAISYQLSAACRVELSVFNTLGQKVKILVSEEKPAGIHSVTFDAGGLATGIYYYQMKAGDFIAVKKMLLVR